MSDLQKKLNKIISDIEKNLSNKEDFEYVKTQIYNIYTVFLDEFDEIENSIEKIESDIYVKVNEEYDFDVICPYCDTEFSVDFSEGPKESILCPECNNVVELDWNDDHEGCSHDCHECGGECGHDHDEEDNEDDM